MNHPRNPENILAIKFLRWELERISKCDMITRQKEPFMKRNNLRNSRKPNKYSCFSFKPTYCQNEQRNNSTKNTTHNKFK